MRVVGPVPSKAAAITAAASIAMINTAVAWQIIAPSSDSFARVAFAYVGGVALLSSAAMHVEARRKNPVIAEITPVNSFTKTNLILGGALLAVSALVGVGFLTAKIGPHDTEVHFGSFTTSIVSKIMQTSAAFALTSLVSAAVAHAVDGYSRQVPNEREVPLLQDGDVESQVRAYVA
ncbi:MAG: hypothetical protein P1U63_00620 [Coxiellaceae bacterium]|nr:hypothetical protein [Coxiellaceae bacterium]